jgi:hypothetical protein
MSVAPPLGDVGCTAAWREKPTLTARPSRPPQDRAHVVDGGRAGGRDQAPTEVAAVTRASISSRTGPGGDGGRAMRRARIVSIWACSASSSSKTAVRSRRPMRRMVRRRTASS